MFNLSKLINILGGIVKPMRKGGGVSVFIKASANVQAQKIALPPGAHVFGGDHACDYVLPGLAKGSAFTLTIDPYLKAAAGEPRGPLAEGFAQRVTPQAHGGFLLDLGGASLLVQGRRPSVFGALARRPAAALVAVAALVGFGVVAGTRAFGWQGPGSRPASAVQPLSGLQAHAPGSALAPSEAFARAANNQLTNLGSGLRATAEAGTVRVSGSASPSEWSAAQDLLEGKARLAGLALILDQPRAPAAPEIKPAPSAPPALQVVAVMERPSPTVVVKGGARLRAGSQLPDGWVVESISLRKVDLRRGSERHSVEF